MTPRQPFRLDARGYDDTQMRARRTVHRVRLDCTAILAAAEERKRRRARLAKLGAVMVLLVGGWAAAYLWGSPVTDAVLFSVVTTAAFTGLLVALDRRAR